MSTPTFEEQLQSIYDKCQAFSDFSHNPNKSDEEVVAMEAVHDAEIIEILKISHPPGVPPNRRRKSS